MLFNNKKGIELGINFIVVLILAIAVFGFGIYFAAQIFSGAKELKADIEQQTERELQDALRAGKQVSIAPTSRDIKAGEGYVFGLGIVNLLGCTRTFTIIAADTKTDELDGDLQFLLTEQQTIANNEERFVPILVKAPEGEADGTYAADIEIRVIPCGESQPVKYGTTQKVFVRVS